MYTYFEIKTITTSYKIKISKINVLQNTKTKKELLRFGIFALRMYKTRVRQYSSHDGPKTNNLLNRLYICRSIFFLINMFDKCIIF